MAILYVNSGKRKGQMTYLGEYEDTTSDQKKGQHRQGKLIKGII